MSDVINKAGIKPIPIQYHSISAAEVIEYLQNQLGFAVAYDFTRWVGISPDHSYVRLRVIMNADDIVMPIDSGSTYAERVLHANSAGVRFRESVIEKIAPFMYPANFNDILKDRANIDKMAMYGLYGDRLEDIIRHNKLEFIKEKNMVITCLRVDNIIKDMLANPATNDVDGKFEILFVTGTTNDTMRFNCSVSENKNIIGTNPMLSFDQLYNWSNK